MRINTNYKHIRKRGWPALAGLLLSICVQITSTPAMAQSAGQKNSTEEQKSDALIAAYLYNFAKFTSWPSANDLDNSIQFCIAKNAISRETFKGWGRKKVQKRAVRVSFFNDLNADHLSTCSVMYIGQGNFDDIQLNTLKKTATINSILLVSDQASFGQDGGQIELYFEDRKLRFKVNLEAIQEANLNMGAAVLRLAQIVKSDRGHK